jgi:SAM-dependent methyltransferase
MLRPFTRDSDVYPDGRVRCRYGRNHNIHYHRLVIAAVPAGCQRALDVGCGEGMLARKLARHASHVVGIDQDAASIDAARRQNVNGQIGFVRGDFLTCPFQPASFGLISCVAALHHMDAAAASPVIWPPPHTYRQAAKPFPAWPWSSQPGRAGLVRRSP